MSRFERAARLFQQVRRLDPARRQALLQRECGQDHQLRDEVLALLEEHDRPDDPLDSPALGSDFSLIAGVGARPTRIGAYRIREPIGEGGMGVVYLAEQGNPRRTVALKLIRPGLASADVLRRFEHEALALGQLHHPGIAQIHEAGIENGVPFIAMERVEGPALLEYVRAEQLETPERLRLFCRICDAVQHAHQRGVIHRDLKPGNILVEGTGPRAQPKVLDFGVARLTDADLKATTLKTSLGELLGTVQYMSPEQASGDPEAIDTRADVYALGVILFELLSGRLPHDLKGKRIPEAVRIIQDQDPTSLVSIDPAFKGDIDTVVNKALAREKDRRYASAAELAEDLRRSLRDEPIAARPPSAGYHLSKFARRHRSVVAGAAAVLVALVIGLCAAVWQWRAAVSARNAEAVARAGAERRFMEVRSLANTFIHEFDRLIMHLPGALEARRMIVSTALQFLDRLAAEDQSDEQLLLELVSAYERVGDIQGAPRSSNVGDTEGALGSYRKALAIVERLVLERPGRKKIRVAQALVLTRIASLQSALGHGAEALLLYRRARSLVDDDPVVSAQIDSLTGNALLSLDRPEKALELFQSTLVESTARASSDSDDPEALRDLAVDHFKISICLNMLERFDESLESLRRYQEICETIVRLRPDSAQALRDLSVGHEHLGVALTRLGRPGEAAAEVQAAIEIDERLIAADPSNVRPRIDLTTHLINLGEHLLAQGRRADARSSFARSHTFVEELLVDDPDSAVLRRLLGVVLSKFAEAEQSHAVDEKLPQARRIERWQAARGWLEQARTVFLELRSDGILGPLDAAVPDDLTREMEACDQAILALSRPD